MANDFDYFPFYLRRFLADDKVEAMTSAEVGAYLLLLLRAWDQEPVGSVPNDHVILARWARMDGPSWDRVKEKILGCFKLCEGRWHQSFMQEVYAKVVGETQRRSNAAKKAAHDRWEKEKHKPPKNKQVTASCERNATAMRLPAIKENEIKPNEKKTTLAASESPPGKISREPEADGDLDSEIRRYIGGHPMLTWDPRTHGKCRKLVESVGWPKALELVEQGIAAQAIFPIGWALGTAANQEQAATAAPGKKSAYERQLEEIDKAFQDLK